MASLTLSAVQTQVRDLVGDATATSNTWSDQQVTDAINFAVKDYCRKTEVSYLEASANLDSAGKATIPSDYLEVKRVYYSGSVLLKSTKKFESMKSATWLTDSGTATRSWVEYSGSQIKLVPVLTAWGSGSPTCTIGYVQAPTDLASSGDFLDSRIPVPHQIHLKYAAAAYLLQFDGDAQDQGKADKYLNEFNALIGVK